MKRINLIEYLRGYSILTIVIYHYLQTLHMQNIGGKLIAFGGTGVHLFILLSGFGLYYSHLHKPITFIDFIKKRITKVYYPYILVVLASALIALLIPIYQNSWYALGGHIFLYKMFDESIMGSYGYPLWFISLIIQFYLIFNFYVKLKEKLSTKQFLILNIIISILWTVLLMIIGKESERVWNSCFIRYSWEFSLGMVLAAYYVGNNYTIKYSITNTRLFIIGFCACALYGSLALFGGVTGKLTNDFPALIGYSFIAIWIYRLSIKSFNKFILYTGKISYSLYLLHTLSQLVVMHYIKSYNIYISLIISFILSYIISDLYQKFINFVYRVKGI